MQLPVTSMPLMISIMSASHLQSIQLIDKRLQLWRTD